MSYPFEQTIVSNQIAPRNAVYRVRSPIAGQIREYRVTVAAANNNGATVFTLKRADASTIATLVIPAGQTTLALFAPIASVAKWEVITVDLTTVPPGGVAGPIDFLIDIDSDVFTVGLPPTVFVNTFYQGALNRLPTGAEQAAALANLDAPGNSGDTLGLRAVAKALGETVFNSAEYTARGRTDAQYIADLWGAYLGRAAEAGESAFWLAEIGVRGRNGVRAAVAGGVDFYNRRVAQLYPGIAEAADAAFIGGKKVAVTNPVNLDILQYNAAASAFINVPNTGGGGGTGLTYFDIDLPPAAPSPLDDEFAAPGLNAKWAKVNFATNAVFTHDVDTTLPHHLFLKDSNSGIVEAILQTLPAGDFTVVTKGHVLNGPNGTFRHWGLMLADGVVFGAGKQTTLTADVGVGNVSIYNYANFVFSGTQSSLGPGDTSMFLKFVYLRITRTAGVYKASYSYDGYNFGQNEPVLTPSGYVPTHVGIYLATSSGKILEVGIDYFRLYPSATVRLGGKRNAL